jgi:hypothetical protein
MLIAFAITLRDRETSEERKEADHQMRPIAKTSWNGI